MHSKRGIELSLNFIVILIISIVIFGFGVRFIYKLSSQATELQGLTLSELDDKIGNLICEGSDRVCIGEDRKTIPRTKFEVFGLKVVNILDDKEFRIEVNASNPIGFQKDRSDIPDIVRLIILPSSRQTEIKKNEEKNLGIGIEVPSNAAPGTYIFNINITDLDTNTAYTSIQKIYVDVP